MMLSAIVLSVAVAAAQPGSLCVLCHPDVRVSFEPSVHREEGVTCGSCHGGDETTAVLERAHGRGFRGSPRRREVPQLCASCHSEISKMKAYNLPADQLALYQTSQHGKALALGNDKVAVCTDCHGTHDTLKGSDPRSRAHPRNIPATCGHCHTGNLGSGRTAPAGDPYQDYLQGVHGRALLEQGNATAPHCARCHGAHGATPPGVGDIDKLCGQCHAKTRSYFLAGPHRAAMLEAGLHECASCHGHHRIERSGLEMLEKICLECHEAGSGEARRGAEIRSLYVSASEQLDEARRLVERAAEVPLYVDDYQARLEEARTLLLESPQVMHTVDPAQVEEVTRRARSIGREIEAEVHEKMGAVKWRKIGLAVFWFYLLLTLGVLAQMRRRAAREAGA